MWQIINYNHCNRKKTKIFFIIFMKQETKILSCHLHLCRLLCNFMLIPLFFDFALNVIFSLLLPCKSYTKIMIIMSCRNLCNFQSILSSFFPFCFFSIDFDLYLWDIKLFFSAKMCLTFAVHFELQIMIFRTNCWILLHNIARFLWILISCHFDFFFKLKLKTFLCWTFSLLLSWFKLD